MPGNGASIEADGLTIRFDGHVAVDGVSCTVGSGELTAIVGPNGAGKTTFFNLVSGQLKPTSGTVRFDGRDIAGMSPAARARLGIGRAFQLTNLFPALTAMENLRLVVQSRMSRGMAMHSVAVNDPEVIGEARRVMGECNLDSLAAEPVSTLPHGEQRKLEVAMLLAMRPRVFMFDEPTAGMSGDEVPAVLELIDAIKRETDKIVMLVEHKIDVISYLADRIIVLHEGRLVADGSPDEVMRSEIVQRAYLGVGDGEGEDG